MIDQIDSKELLNISLNIKVTEWTEDARANAAMIKTRNAEMKFLTCLKFLSCRSIILGHFIKR